MQVTEYVCDQCGESCFKDAEINGQKIPIVVRMELDTGPGDDGRSLDLNATGVYVPHFVRELLGQLMPRRELCVRCLATALNLPLVDAQGNALPAVEPVGDVR